MALKYFLTVFVILAVPARDAFNFVLDLASYPNLVSVALPLDALIRKLIIRLDIPTGDGCRRMDLAEAAS